MPDPKPPPGLGKFRGKRLTLVPVKNNCTLTSQPSSCSSCGLVDGANQAIEFAPMFSLPEPLGYSKNRAPLS